MQKSVCKLLAMASSSSSSGSSYSSPCAACKFLRRKCLPGCTFAPYFPPEDPQKFINVHKIFGASNVTKLLNDLLPHQREDAVNTLAYEAEARIRDPVYGCVGAITFLQRQVQRLQKELDAANSDLIRYKERPSSIVLPNDHTGLMITPGVVYPNLHANRAIRPVDLGRRVGNGGFHQGGTNPSFNLPLPYNNNLPWNGNSFSGDHQGNM